MRKKLTVLAVCLAAAVSAVPAQAVLDEGGGAAPRSEAPRVVTEFDWADAGIGVGVGAALALTLVVGVVVRRYYGRAREIASPAPR